ncbi:unnamed protein product, partial [Iphiclides podalirius]
MVNDQEPTSVTISRHVSGDSKRAFGAEEGEGESLCGAVAGAGGADAAWWGACAAEAVGAALLVLLTCLPACAEAPPLQRALAGGLIVATLVQCFDHISGAMMNPTVTLAAAVCGRVGWAKGAAYCAAQLAGALAGGAALHALAPAAAACCRTAPAAGVATSRAAALEALLGALLALANCAAWDAANRRLLDSWPLRIGLTVAALSLAAGELTGASMNPVRSLAPALFSGDWSAHWVYWAGPLSGSLLASGLYRCAWRSPRQAPPRGL